MATKLTGFNKVAVIKQGYGTYHFAIYDDGYEYLPGDTVIVSGNNQIQKIDEIITSEEAAERFNKNITAEVICKIDTSDYDKRIENRKQAADTKKKMDVIIQKMDEENKYKMYAMVNSELKELLDKYRKLIS